ncbi:membrane protein insertase YidC [Nocardioides anomalus]|uniref:Membrane protein insertase YidC n=1 Tax=Nocardioides anomalus TaxID=2712223 RepID=A0A6G6WEJ9_9ACTN|nr:membrane protein insertase YidC [Nocardioides anomalus]QIG43771.1 membrane protein insertase YidC [Nocardioides anomalus]
MSLLDPLSHALATVVAVAHAGLTGAGLDPGSGTTWVLSVAAVVVTVRLALVPLAVHGARQARAAARARPQLRALAERYRDRRDAASLRAYAEERRAVAAEHRLSPWGCLPLLAQLPVWFALYHLLTDVAAGTPVGALDGGLVASLGAATVLGVPLAQRGYLGAGAAHLAVVAGLALGAAALSFPTQRLALASADVPEAMARVQQLLPALSVAGLLVAGGFVPLALLVYWGLNNGWTLGQTVVLRRLVPVGSG